LASLSNSAGAACLAVERPAIANEVSRPIPGGNEISNRRAFEHLVDRLNPTQTVIGMIRIPLSDVRTPSFRQPRPRAYELARQDRERNAMFVMVN
jgi:hypothetical protein